MRTWKETTKTEKKIAQVICNGCGKEFLPNINDAFPNCFHVETRWEYGSQFDNEQHLFDLCEDCYQKMVNEFSIPIERKNQI